VRPGVVVPAHRAAHVAGRSVAAFRAQTLAADWVLVDDGSDDDTDGALRAAASGAWTDGATVCVLRLDVNSGRAAARNAGVAVLPPSADPVVFLDVDAEPEPDLLRRFALAFEDPAVAAVVARIRPVGGDPRDPYVRYLASSARGPERGGGPVHWRHFLTTAAAVRRAALDAAGGFDPTITYGEDLELAARLAARDPNGLRADDGPPVAMHDPGTLATAVAKLTEFARDNLPVMIATHPELAAWTRADSLSSPAVRAALRLAPLAERLLPALPGPISNRAVRLMLARTFAEAWAVGSRAATFMVTGDARDPERASAWAEVVAAGAPDDLVDRIALAASEAVANIVEHGTPPGRLTLRRDAAGWWLDVVESGPGPTAEAIHAASMPVADALGGRGLPLLATLATTVERRPGRLRLHFR